VHEFNRRRGVARDPVAFAGGADVDQRLGPLLSARRDIRDPGLTMRMTIGKPIPTDNMRSSDRTELTRKLEEAVRASSPPKSESPVALIGSDVADRL